MINSLTEKNWIDDFIKTDSFSVALGMIWRNGYESAGYFQFTHKSEAMVRKYADFFDKNVRSRYWDI
ncbi:hypothetical protein [Bacillus cereus group sp. BfR-BA-01700]|uniref:hypothetical protein n=1 Tax=Bacillus cereus group sp. BfR-BA-01700 TaxID=3094884 RepID=UPI0029C55313|nr:hypothetical protein [Bacillus cereus group sp. BfR-BA-01700]MDX5841149.1 hypothetical protein [Bacillus cereus group sp. BfR-BA-01700]